MKKIMSSLLLTAATGLSAAPQRPAVGSWSDVQKLDPATEVLIAVADSAPLEEVFLLADPSSLFVLDKNVTSTFGREAERTIRDIATTHAVEIVGGGGQFISNDVRLGPDGVFVSNRKVAELSQVIRRIDRSDVVQLSATGQRRRGAVLKATATGAAIGAGVGLALSATIFRCGAGCAEDWTRVAVTVGTGVGAAVGATVAAGHRGHELRLIYSAP